MGFTQRCSSALELIVARQGIHPTDKAHDGFRLGDWGELSSRDRASGVGFQQTGTDRQKLQPKRK